MRTVTYRELVAMVTETVLADPTNEKITYLLRTAETLLGMRVVYTDNKDREPVFELTDWKTDTRDPDVPGDWNRAQLSDIYGPDGFEIQAYTNYSGGYNFFGRSLANTLIPHIPEIFELATPLLTFSEHCITAETVEFRIDYRTGSYGTEPPVHYWEVQMSSNAAVENSVGITIEEDEESPVSRFIASLFQPLFEAAGCPAIEPAMGQDLWDRGELPIAILRRPNLSKPL